MPSAITLSTLGELGKLRLLKLTTLSGFRSSKAGPRARHSHSGSGLTLGGFLNLDLRFCKLYTSLL